MLFLNTPPFITTLMFSKNELRYTLALQRVPYLGDATAKKLILKVGSAEGVFSEKKRNLLKIKGIGPFKLRALSKKIQLREAEKEIEFMKKNDVKFIMNKQNILIGREDLNKTLEIIDIVNKKINK